MRAPPRKRLLSGNCLLVTPAGSEEFVKRLVAAINSRDPDETGKLVPPENLACIKKLNKEDYDMWFKLDFRKILPDDYTFNLSDISVDDPLPFEGLVLFLVRPTHQLAIHYESSREMKGDTLYIEGGTLIRWVIDESGKWFYDMPCPEPAMLEILRK